MFTMDNYEKIIQDIYDGRYEMKNVKALVPNAKGLLDEEMARIIISKSNATGERPANATGERP
jgi:hypothetical protein